MKKQMERTVYEAPVTERFSVELEGGFMSASIYETPKNGDISAKPQEYESFEGDNAFYKEEGKETIWF